MMKEEIIRHREYIEKLGQQKYFQIELPFDVKRIIGIETGVFRYASNIALFGGNLAEDPASDPIEPQFKIGFNDPVGSLVLQTTDKPGIIYQGEIRQTDFNCKWADFTMGLYADLFDQFSHDRKRYEDVIITDLCTPRINGYYKDCWGEHYSYQVEYELLIYLWIEKKV
jgi:hypothetical protein